MALRIFSSWYASRCTFDSVCYSHPFVACAWTVLALYNTMTNHSGYAIPLVGDPLAHDWHHEVRLSLCVAAVGAVVVGLQPHIPE